LALSNRVPPTWEQKTPDNSKVLMGSISLMKRVVTSSQRQRNANNSWELDFGHFMSVTDRVDMSLIR
jgi:hypothetical protein